MSQDLVPQNFGQLSSLVTPDMLDEADEFGASIVGGFAILGYRGKVWRLRYRGEEQNLINTETKDPLSSVEVVMVRAAPVLSKLYYAKGYVEGSSEAPDCWSSNGQTPDASVQAPVCESCVACPMNAFGSRITEAGKKGKACSDSKRVAIVPLEDIDNEVYGGPMLTRVPAASLQELKLFSDKMKSLGYPIFAVGVRIRFDINEPYPKLTFSAIRPLTDDEMQKVLALRDDPRTARILNETVEAIERAAAPVEEEESAFEQPPAKPAPAPQPAPVAPKAAPARPVAATATKPATTLAAAPKPAPAKPAPRLGGIAAAVANPTVAAKSAPKPVPQQVEENAPSTIDADLDAELEALLKS
jgi:hypothetical protein